MNFSTTVPFAVVIASKPPSSVRTVITVSPSDNAVTSPLWLTVANSSPLLPNHALHLFPYAIWKKTAIFVPP